MYTIRGGPPPNVVSMNFYLRRSSHDKIIECINDCEHLECHGFRVVLCSAYLQEVVLETPWNMIHLMPCRIPCRLHINLVFTYLLRWSLKRSGEAILDHRLRLLHQWECSKCNGHGLSVSCVKWPYERTTHVLHGEWGEPTTSYRWTAWVSEITRVGSSLPKNYS